jgi:von Willebrand factor type A domain
VTNRLAGLAADWLTDWRALSVEQLQFWHRDTAALALIALLACTVVALAVRLLRRPRPGRDGIVLPALPSLLRVSVIPPFDLAQGAPSVSRGAWRGVRHLPFLPFAAGIPFLLLALADPYSALISENVSFPGRRISLMIDASTSMTTTFKTETLNTISKSGPAFFTTVAAAERFVQLRRAGRYRDLLALVEFGDQAYVITPFTSDYDNILLSIALIKDPVEFSMFPNRGTVIARALEQSLELFEAFEFLDASGNLMVIFTDGEDTTALLEGRKLDEILESAVANHVPLYFVRTNYEKDLGELIPDRAWKEAVERTGGRFYAVSDESSLLRAIADIDRSASGAIRVTHYSSQEPKFALFAGAACLLWLLAATLKLTIPRLQQLP